MLDNNDPIGFLSKEEKYGDIKEGGKRSSASVDMAPDDRNRWSGMILNTLWEQRVYVCKLTRRSSIYFVIHHHHHSHHHLPCFTRLLCFPLSCYFLWWVTGEGGWVNHNRWVGIREFFFFDKRPLLFYSVVEKHHYRPHHVRRENQDFFQFPIYFSFFCFFRQGEVHGGAKRLYTHKQAWWW